MLNSKIDKMIKDVYPFIDHDRHITGHLFYFIEKNDKFLTRYNNLVNDYDQHKVNKRIGRRIRKLYELPNTGTCKSPKSTLIKSYTLH